LAGETAACCKLSGLLTEAHAGAGVDALDRYVAHVFACFGPKRVVWGSDWPVLNRASDYGRWLAVARELVRRHAPGCEPEVFGTNAVAFYGLEAGVIAGEHSPPISAAAAAPLATHVSASERLER